MGIEAIALAVAALFFGLLIMWFSSLGMINKRDIIGFFPFFSMSFVLIVYATFILFEFYLQFAWMVLELLILLNLIWILVAIRRENE